MPTLKSVCTAGLLVVLGLVGSTWANDPILQVGDSIIAIDASKSDSWYPPAENPSNAFDSNPATKYLNFGKENTGLIATLGAPIVVQSLTLSTANDAEGRDPASYAIYGTNDPILSKNNSNGVLENWTLISQGSLSLPATRLTAGSAVGFSNSTPFMSYRVVFPTIKDSATTNSMQIGEIGLHATGDGTGANALSGSSVRAIDLDVLAASHSSTPASGNENAFQVLDGNPSTKYLNFGRIESGIIVTPQAGRSVIKSLQMATANDAPERDPMTFELYGTNDLITSGNNSFGDAENWTLIASGGTGLAGLAANRLTLGELVTIANDAEFTSYKLVFPELRLTNASGGLANPNSMQIGDIQFFGTIIPEPATLMLVAVAALAARARRRTA